MPRADSSTSSGSSCSQRSTSYSYGSPCAGASSKPGVEYGSHSTSIDSGNVYHQSGAHHSTAAGTTLSKPEHDTKHAGIFTHTNHNTARGRACIDAIIGVSCRGRDQFC